MTKSEFIQANPIIVDDVRKEALLKKLKSVDFARLHAEIQRSSILQNKCSLTWLLKIYERIISGQFRDFQHKLGSYKKKPKLIAETNYLIHTQNERKYSKEELESFIDDVSKING